jgi:peptide/nickel transport system substrate-binding protein
VLNNLREAGIRANLRPIERAAFIKSYTERKLKNLVMGATAAYGNAATRLEVYVVKGGAYAYGNYPDIDALFQQQASELGHGQREMVLHKIQQFVEERVIAAPIWQLGAHSGVGPRVGESGFGLIAGNPWTSPYEDITLKAP